MIYDAIEKLKTERDFAFSIKKLNEYNTFCEIIRLMYRCSTDNTSTYAVNIDKIISHVKQGNYAHMDKDVKRLCNKAKRM